MRLKETTEHAAVMKRALLLPPSVCLPRLLTTGSRIM